MHQNAILLVVGVASFLAADVAAGAEATHRYFRFVTVETRAAIANSVQVAEFRFSLGGDVLPMEGVIASNPGGNSPAGEPPSFAIDGNVGSKWLDFNKQPIVFDFGEPVTIDRYTYATANDAPDRDPVSWRLEGSDDGLDWVVLDARNSQSIAIDRFTYLGNYRLGDDNVLEITSFTSERVVTLNGSANLLSWDVRNAALIVLEPEFGEVDDFGTEVITVPDDTDAFYTLTATSGEDVVSRIRPMRSVAGGMSSHRFVRFTQTKLRSDVSANSIQLAEFRFFLAGSPVTVSSVSNPDGSTPLAEGAANLIDGNVNTKWLDFNKSALVFDFGEVKDFDGYAFTTANDAFERDPLRWILEGSDDGTGWTLIENMTAFDFPVSHDRLTSTEIIPLPGSSLIPLPDPEPGDLFVLSYEIDPRFESIAMTFRSEPGRSYRLVASEDMVNWDIVVLDGVVGASLSDETSVFAAYLGRPRMFFRVEETVD